MYLSFFLLLLAKGSKSSWQPWVPIHFWPSINSWECKSDPEFLAWHPSFSELRLQMHTTALSLCSVGDWIEGFGHARQALYLSSPERVSLLQVGLRWSEWSMTSSSHSPPVPFVLQQLRHHASCKLRHSVPCCGFSAEQADLSGSFLPDGNVTLQSPMYGLSIGQWALYV